MTETTQDILNFFQIRKTKKQKQAFITYLAEKANQMGYSLRTEKGMFGARNIIVGDVDNAKVIYTAHYDTCAVLPFPNFIAPKCFILYLLYQIAIIIGFFVVAFIVGFLFGMISVIIGLGSEITSGIAVLVYCGLLILLIAGPANKHTANDNTSGVTTLIDIMASLTDQQKQKAAFVFFDLEEAGLIGSSSFASKHKSIKKETLVVNFDCVSDGNNMLFILRKNARIYADKFKEAFKGNDNIHTEVLTKNIFYPSDQSNFKKGVGVAAFRKTKKLSILYLSRIHTPKDTVYKQENIEFLKQGSIKLLDLI